MSKDLEAIDDPFYAEPLPKGKGKIVYDENTPIAKNKLIIDIRDLTKTDKIKTFNKLSDEELFLSPELNDKMILDFSTYNPGFYEVTFYNKETEIYNFTMIKCFPIVITYDNESGKYLTSQTLW